MNYALIKMNPLSVVAFFSGIPEPLVWPDGAASHAVGVGFVYDQWKVVSSKLDEPPHVFCSEDGIDSVSLEDDVLLVKRKWHPLSLERVKQELLDGVEFNAEQGRRRYITVSDGQTMVYADKLREARAYQQSSSGSFPMLEAGIGVDGSDLKAVADKIIKSSDAWTSVAAKIERQRLIAKDLIRRATSVEEAIKAADSVVWPWL